MRRIVMGDTDVQKQGRAKSFKRTSDVSKN